MVARRRQGVIEHTRDAAVGEGFADIGLLTAPGTRSRGVQASASTIVPPCTGGSNPGWLANTGSRSSARLILTVPLRLCQRRMSARNGSGSADGSTRMPNVTCGCAVATTVPASTSSPDARVTPVTWPAGRDPDPGHRGIRLRSKPSLGPSCAPRHGDRRRPPQCRLQPHVQFGPCTAAISAASLWPPIARAATTCPPRHTSHPALLSAGRRYADLPGALAAIATHVRKSCPGSSAAWIERPAACLQNVTPVSHGESLRSAVTVRETSSSRSCTLRQSASLIICSAKRSGIPSSAYTISLPISVMPHIARERRISITAG